MYATATQAQGIMVQNYNLENALSVLDNEGLVLIPTDTLWCVVCDAQNPVSLERLRRLRQPTQKQPFEVLFPDIKMLKEYTYRLHPKLETLLLYHKRPLTILTPANQALQYPATLPNGDIAARVLRDKYCRSLAKKFGRPLACVPAHFSGSPYPTNFGKVRSDIITYVDMVLKFKFPNLRTKGPAVMVQLNEVEELEFVRK